MESRDSVPGERNGESRNRRRRIYESLRRHSPPAPTPPIPDNRAPLHVTRSRTFANPGNSHLQRHRLRRQQDDDNFATVQDAINRLNEVNSNLNSVLDEPLPHVLGPDELSGLREDMDSFNRRNKRRKLDSDPLDAVPSFEPYGHYGQIAPGRLSMTIASCDGGTLMETGDLGHPRRNYVPENVLKNDKSVYRTARDKCNMVLKHLGETPFTLTKVIIKTPGSVFDSPLQEGMIFISMSSEELLSRTSQYQILDSCTHSLYRSSSEQPSAVRSTRLSRDGDRLVAVDLGGGGYHGYHTSAPDSPDTDTTPPPDEVYPFGYMLRSSHLHQHSYTTPQPEFHITASCDDVSGDEEVPSSPGTLLDRHRHRRANLRESSTPDESDSDDRDVRGSRQRRLRGSARKIEWVDSDSDPPVKPPDSRNMPHARFFIDRKKNIVCLKFEPPVSARYVLFKLWSPQGHSSTDVQSISVYGYAGPRFFPGITMA